MPPRKNPTARSEDRPAAGDSGDKKVNSALETIPDAAVAWIAETGNWKNREWPRTFPTPVPALHPLIEHNVIFDEFWTLADEAELAQWWTQEKLAWTSKEQDGYRQLWVRCLLYLHCTPYDVVGVEGNLSHQRGPRGPKGAAASASLWSREFCVELTDLVTHHAWRCGTEGGAKRKLIMALQYAVILRTNDQRVWKIDELEYDFLKDFKQVIQEQSKKGPVPIRQLHKEARKRFRRRTVRPLCSLSDVFSSLEKVVEVSDQPLDTASTQPFSLGRDDLANLAKALDRVISSDNGMALYIPTKVMASCVSLPSIRKGLPKYEELDRWHEVSIKDQRRRMKRRERGTPDAMEIDDATGGIEDSFEPLLREPTGAQEGEQQREQQLQQREQQLQQREQQQRERQLQQLDQLQRQQQELDQREKQLDQRERELVQREQQQPEEEENGEGDVFFEDMEMSQPSSTPPAPGGSPVLGSERLIPPRPKTPSRSQREIPESPGFDPANGPASSVPLIGELSSLTQLELDEENGSESRDIIGEGEITTRCLPTLRNTTRGPTVPALPHRREQHHNLYYGTGPKQGHV